MKTVFDSSAFAKRYIEEAGSQAVEEILQNSVELGLSVICVSEIISALNRRRREGVIEPKDYAQIKQQLVEDISDVMLLDLTPTVIAKSITLLENNILRAMDSLHIACAIEWQADLFVSADLRQISAAQGAGLTTEQV